MMITTQVRHHTHLDLSTCRVCSVEQYFKIRANTAIKNRDLKFDQKGPGKSKILKSETTRPLKSENTFEFIFFDTPDRGFLLLCIFTIRDFKQNLYSNPTID